MKRMNIYLTDVQRAHIQELAMKSGLSFAEMLRRVLDVGLRDIPSSLSGALLEKSARDRYEE